MNAILSIIAACGIGLVGADDPSKAAPPASTPAKPAAEPTLDELLGIKPARPAQPAPADQPAAGTPAPALPTPDANRAALERALSGEELEEAFARAVALMRDAALRLDDHKDPGLDTQRVQEEALKHLDTLISNLQKNSSSSSSSRSQSQNQDPQSGPPSSGQKSQSQPTNSPNPASEPNAPTLKQGALNPALDSARAAWGALPDRVRDMLLQGSSDRFSSHYQRLTEEYYRKLAEDATAPGSSGTRP